MSIVCGSCGKSIEDKSVFCNYCGIKTNFADMHSFDEDKLANLFLKVEQTLCNNSKYSVDDFQKYMNPYLHYENKSLQDNDYYKLLVDIVFYSGFKASTVEKHIKAIHAHFPDFCTAKQLTPDDINMIMKDPDMIQNRSKIVACIKNAITIDEIIKKYGSFKYYIDSFSPNANNESLFKLQKSLEQNFAYIGETTSFHFLMDIGLNVLKPDRVMLRIFYRLGLIKSETDLFGTVMAGRVFSRATGLPIRYIDIVFVLYGQLNQINFECICSDKNPKCQKCGVVDDCMFANKHGA